MVTTGSRLGRAPANLDSGEGDFRIGDSELLIESTFYFIPADKVMKNSKRLCSCNLYKTKYKKSWNKIKQ